MFRQTPHTFHLVDISPWPLLMSFSLLSVALILVNWKTLGYINTLKFSLILLNFFLILFSWFRDIYRESQSGYHTEKVVKGLFLGFIIFLITEVKLFFSLFWAYIHSSLNPSIEISNWPPLGVNSVDYLSLPLLNSILLLSGGFFCTWAHHAFIKKDKKNSIIGLLIGLLLTGIFLKIQYIEYTYNTFTLSDSIYGSTFYALTGLHMFHVLFAFLFILIALYRIYNDSLTSEHALILDSSLIYYHLVDVVWLILYIILYVWAY